MTRDVTIALITTGEAVAQIKVPDGKTPGDAGFPFDPTKHKAFTTSAQADTARQRFDAKLGAWVDDIAKVEADLIDGIKAEAERRRMLVLSPGGSKKSVYAMKAAEIEAWNALGSTTGAILTALGLLPASTRQRKFRFALAEAARRGEANIAAAIQRFGAGADSANAEAARVEAIEQVAVAAVKAATTVAAKRTAANVNWG
ncbi:hypothetical protein [Sphingomonas sp. Leaf4]|uniref:hypothetical protein n=1 Tax=Sphingomonas sp. Leaf4 TaxID=2876553 RepID=UPI001E5878AC|nr:hypothetical protein [Sphingomonas sp. Leaf4]